MGVLDRVLDRDDVLGAVRVDVVDDRGLGGRLAVAGRTGEQHQSLLDLGEQLDLSRQLEFGVGLQGHRDQAERGGDVAALMVDVHAEPGLLLEREREVDLLALLEPLALAVGHDRVDQGLGLLRVEHRIVVDRVQDSVDPDVRLHANRKMQVGRVLGRHQLEQLTHLLFGVGRDARTGGHALGRFVGGRPLRLVGVWGFHGLTPWCGSLLLRSSSRRRGP